MNKKVLVVDDESHIRMLYQEELQAAGFDVALSDGREPIMAVIGRENPDIVVLDIKLGGTVFWDRTHGRPPHRPVEYVRSRIPDVRR